MSRDIVNRILLRALPLAYPMQAALETEAQERAAAAHALAARLAVQEAEMAQLRTGRASGSEKARVSNCGAC